MKISIYWDGRLMDRYFGDEQVMLLHDVLTRKEYDDLNSGKYYINRNHCLKALSLDDKVYNNDTISINLKK